MMYAAVDPTPGISENTTLPRDAKEGCSEFDLGVAAFELSQEEFQPDQHWVLKLSEVFRVSYEARIFVRSSPARRSMWKQVDTGCSRSNPGKPSKHAWRSHGARRQKCPPLTPDGPAGEGHALSPAPSRGAGSAASSRVRPGAGRGRAQV